ncbi:unnamed protein product, partial [Musa hybrid cultivar]
LPRDRVASAPYWYYLLPVPPVYVPIYSSHVGFRFVHANEIFCIAWLNRRRVLEFDIWLMHSGCFLHNFQRASGLEFDEQHEETPLSNLNKNSEHRGESSSFIQLVSTKSLYSSADSFRRLDVDTFRHPGTSQRSVRRLSLTPFPSGRGAATIRGLPRRTKTLPRALRRRLPPRRPNRTARLQRDRPRAVRARAESAASFTARGPDALPPRARQRASTSRRR